ncbi:hypothetical protein RCL1_007332 [Eukaryota sp. TZLM3-RCL]
MSEQEEVCFDDLIRSIVKSVFPYSIMDKNIVFTNPNTLERNDLESLKALICSIESETMFKSCQHEHQTCVVNNYFSFKTSKGNISQHLFLPKSLLIYILLQNHRHCRNHLQLLDLEKDTFGLFDVSKGLKSMCNVSVLFRCVYVEAFKLFCNSVQDHLLTTVPSDFRKFCLVSYCLNGTLSSTNTVFLPSFFQQFPATALKTNEINLESTMFFTEKIRQLFLYKFEGDISLVTNFSNILSFSLEISPDFTGDLASLASCTMLQSVQIDECDIDDLSGVCLSSQLTSFYLRQSDTEVDVSHLSVLDNLNCLELHHCEVTDLSLILPMQSLTLLSLRDNDIDDMSLLVNFEKLTSLSLEGNQISDISSLSSLTSLTVLKFREIDVEDISALSYLQQLVHLSIRYCAVTDICPLSPLSRLSSLELSCEELRDISPLAPLIQLVNLSLDNCKVSDLTPLSGMKKLERLSLQSSYIFDLSPLSDVPCLSFLDVCYTRLAEEFRREFDSRSAVKRVIGCCQEHIVVDCSDGFLDEEPFINCCEFTHCSEIKEFIMVSRLIQNISTISALKNLRLLDLSNVTIEEHDSARLADISFLSSCVVLNSLTLDDTDVEDLSPLSSLSQLSVLSLNNTEVKDLTPINCLHNLTSLSADSIYVSDPIHLISFKQLQRLSFDNNGVSDISSLSTLDKLLHLSLCENKIKDLTLTLTLTQT